MKRPVIDRSLMFYSPSFFRIPNKVSPDRRREAPIARILEKATTPVSGRAGPEEFATGAGLTSDEDSEGLVPAEKLDA